MIDISVIDSTAYQLSAEGPEAISINGPPGDVLDKDWVGRNLPGRAPNPMKNISPSIAGMHPTMRDIVYASMFLVGAYLLVHWLSD